MNDLSRTSLSGGWRVLVGESIVSWADGVAQSDSARTGVPAGAVLDASCVRLHLAVDRLVGHGLSSALSCSRRTSAFLRSASRLGKRIEPESRGSRELPFIAGRSEHR